MFSQRTISFQITRALVEADFVLYINEDAAITKVGFIQIKFETSIREII